MSKRIFIIIIITVTIIFSFIIRLVVSRRMKTTSVSNKNTITSNVEKETSNTICAETVDFSNKKYYLHKSDLEKPLQEACLKAQKEALQELNETEIKNVQQILRETHIMLEYRLIDAVRLIKEPDSPYWAKFNMDEPYLDPLSGNIVKSDGFYNNIEDLKKIENIIKEPETKEKIKEIYTKFQIAMDNHDLEGCFKAHEAIHDYDYWIINYPVYFETYPPADWGGITTYFGTIQGNL